MPNFWRLNTMPLPKIQQLHWSMMIFGKKCIYLILYPLIGNLTTHIAKVNSMTYQLWRFMIGDTKLDFFCLNMRRFIFFSKNLHIRIVFSSWQLFQKTNKWDFFFCFNSTYYDRIVAFIFWKNSRMAKSPFETNWSLVFPNLCNTYFEISLSFL